MRRALSLAIDRRRIVRSLGGRAVAAGQLVPQGIFGHVPDRPPLPFDPREAARLLAEAGYPQGFRAELTYTAGASIEGVARGISEMLEPIGVRLTPVALDWPTMVARWEAGRLPLFVSGWRFETGEASAFLRECLRLRSARGEADSFNPGYSNPRLDRLIEENTRPLDERKRRRHYETLMSVAMEEMPLIPLYEQVDLYAVSERVRWEPRLDTKLLAAEMSLAGS